MSKRCCVPFCNKLLLAQKGQVVSHRFPNVTEPNRLNIWLARIGRIDLFMKDPLFVYKSKRLCSSHFSEKQRIKNFNKNRSPLMKTAVPDLCLPYQSFEVLPSAAERDHDYILLPQHEVYTSCIKHSHATDESTPKHDWVDEDFLNIKSSHICLFCMKILDKHTEINIQTQITREGRLVEDYLRTTLLSVGLEKLFESYFVCSNCLESINQFEEYLSKCDAIQAVLQTQYDEHSKLKQDRKQSKEDEFLILNTGEGEIPTFDFPVLCDTKDYATVCTQTGEDADEEAHGDILRELLTDNNTFQEGTNVEGEKFYSDGIEITNPAWIKRIKRQHGLKEKVMQQPRVKKKVVAVPQHSGSGYCCDKCGKVYWKYVSFKRHEDYHKNKGIYTCEICSKTFTTRVGLQSHTQIHSGIKPHTCESCDKKFRTASALLMHNNSMHPLATNNCGFCCHHCGKLYFSYYAFQAHMQVHKYAHKLRCEICDKTFAQRSSLKTHNMIHDGLRPHKCQICEKTYRHLAHFKAHLNSHNGIRNFICDTCGKAFVTRSNLNNHMNIHKTIKPYICPVCGRGFSHRVNMKAHIRALHKEVEL